MTRHRKGGRLRRTLLGSDIRHGGFGGPVVKFTEIDGEFGVLVGGRGGWIINDSFVIGAGGAAWDPLGWGPDWDEDIDAFFVTEPALNILVNVTKHLRIGFGASYRFVGDVELPGLDNEDISGPAGVVTLKLGGF